MRNLQVVKYCDINFNCDVIGQCFDADNGYLFLLMKGFTLKRAELHNENPHIETVYVSNSTEDVSLTNLEANDIIHTEFIVENGSVLVATKNGNLLRIGVSSFNSTSEYIHKHNKAISSLSISPEQDLIVFADADDELFVMSIDGTTLASENALLQNESLHKPVGVGWGSKETQFFGLDGRPSIESQEKDKITISDEQLRYIENIEASDLFKKFRHNREKNTVVDWRGDGQYIATLTYLPDTGKHRLKVWNRNLELQYLSEQLIGIESGIISWIPNGQYICCTQRRNQQICDIIMFEKNGMTHQRISLPTMLDNIYIKDTLWSPDSRILAIVANQYYVDNDGEINYKPILMLYTTQNFHYYLKTSIYLSENTDYFLRWNTNNCSRLYIISSGGQFSELDCSFVVNHSKKLHNVAVIDGSRVLLTPFMLCRIPPPMSAIEVDLCNPIYRLVIDNNRQNCLIILTLDSRLFRVYQDRSSHSINKSSNISFKNKVARLSSDQSFFQDEYRIDDAHNIQHVLTTTLDDTIIVIRSIGGSSELVEVKLEQDLSISSNPLTTITNNQVVRVSNESDRFAMILSDKSILMYDYSTNLIRTLSTGSSQLATMKSDQTIVGLHVIEFQPTILLTLGQDMTLKLYNENLSDSIISNSCTSFRCCSDYLIFTTTDNLLHIIHKRNLLASIHDTVSQPIESGAILIAVDEIECGVILQMPRGNIEIIHPRLLVLSSITLDLLVGGKSSKIALDTARRHRLDMNFLADFSLTLADGGGNFIRDLVERSKTEELCLFLTELADYDTIAGRYSNFMPHIHEEGYTKNETFIKDKTDKICNLILSEIEKKLSIDPKRDYIEVRLLAYLKCSPRRFSEVLNCIFRLDKSRQTEALKFVLYYVTIDQLFDEALKMYDTDIALLVAGASNKDPKEYLSLLDKFNELSTNETMFKYKIDLHLKRYDNALEHLATLCKNDASLESELVDLVTSKKIYRFAIDYFMSLEVRPKSLTGTLWSKFGDYLLIKRCYLEAGIAFFKAMEQTDNEEHFKAAIKCFMLASNWEISIAMITKSRVSDSLKEETLKKILSRLVEDGCVLEAMILQQSNGAIQDDLIEVMIKSSSWYILDYVTSGSKRNELCSAVRDRASNLVKDWTSQSTVAKSHLERLKYLLSTYQARKQARPGSEHFISDSLSTVDGSEISSVSGSTQRDDGVSGASSIKTRKTSKKNTSQWTKKKRINIKMDTRYEDMALVLELKSFVSKLHSWQKESMRISAALSIFADYSSAKLVSKEIKSIISDNLSFSEHMVESLWPAGPHCEQMYSLYKRFADECFPAESYENIDFEVLIRPEVPDNSVTFELF